MRKGAGVLWDALRAPVFAAILAVLAGSLLLLLLGENPAVLYQALGNSLFTSFGLGYALFYATPLLLAGLAVAIPYQCGLFNIGGEGQLYIGAIAVVAVAVAFPGAPALIAVPLGILAAALAGCVWGGLAGFLKARRGSHEVIVTILLNFIAIAISNYLILYPYKDPTNQAPETVAVAPAYHIFTLGGLFPSTPVNSALFLAIFVAIVAWVFLFRTTWGFELRAVGRSETASRFAGIGVGGRLTLAMFLGGACAGLVGVNEVMGYHHSLIEGFSPGYGFTGIAVALLARNHPIGLLGTALLFGVLQNSARELEFLSEKVTKELSLVLQAGIIALVACDRLLAEKWQRFLKWKEARRA